MENKLFLSPSRIKLAKGCSWKYWCRYHLGLPDRSNDGANRGTICHLILELLGNKRHKKHFTRIIKAGSIFASKQIVRVVFKHAKRLGVDDEENIALIDEMIVSGLRHDFFGTKIGRPTISISEHPFEITKKEDDIEYSIRGILDKLFVYKGKKFAIFRDFKTSKEIFKGSEVTDNFQDWMYSLAIKKEFPFVDNIRSEFIFLRHKDKKKSTEIDDYPHIIKMEDIDDDSLEGFEHELTAYQKYLENFSEKDAYDHFAANMPFPKDGSFSGRLECGFAKYKGQLKKDGNIMWHCPYKFDFDYYAVFDKNDKLIATYFEDDFKLSMVPAGGSYEKRWYAGCPVWQKND